jgi:hypothetical protein
MVEIMSSCIVKLCDIAVKIFRFSLKWKITHYIFIFIGVQWILFVTESSTRSFADGVARKVKSKSKKKVKRVK